ncbi:hypothetical protein [Micromonospora sp. RTP1Z1]|uniref:hypothetical protein n=1 Tax=Micromonospora sp. RTP1Z1 TaxID=2994043 RepID=UPI0029C8C8D6|nr:hypothetical protein [Micromonospora sp. RTP1Z1]
MTWRTRLLAVDVVVVVALAAGDSWLVDHGPWALPLAIIALIPAVTWGVAAPTPAWAWSVSALLLGVLLASVWVSRVYLSHGPAAPPIDWALPSATVSIIVCTLAMMISRSWRWNPVMALAALAVTAGCWGLLQRDYEGECCMSIPASDAAPATSALDIADAGHTECGQDGGLCDRVVAIRTTLTTAEVRKVLRSHGWSEDCRPVTGTLSNLGWYRYGSRCISIESRQPGTIEVSLLAKADWWSRLERELKPSAHHLPSPLRGDILISARSDAFGATAGYSARRPVGGRLVSATAPSGWQFGGGRR